VLKVTRHFASAADQKSATLFCLSLRGAFEATKQSGSGELPNRDCFAGRAMTVFPRSAMPPAADQPETEERRGD
jgi:hypothetical protein